MMEKNDKRHNIDYVKRLAKKLKKEKGLAYHEALNKTVQNFGFSNWVHFNNSHKSLINSNDLLVVSKSELVGLSLNGFSEGDADFDPKIFSGNNNIEILRREIKKHFRKIKSFNFDRGSYGLKHDLERHVGGYVSNGELIYAMYLEGFKIKRDSINCYFNLSLVSLRNLRLSNRILNSFDSKNGIIYNDNIVSPKKFIKYKYKFNFVCWLKMLDEIPKRNIYGVLGAEIDESPKTIKQWFALEKYNDQFVPEEKLLLLSRIFGISPDQLKN